MKEEEKSEKKILKEDILSFYKEYYKDNIHKSELPNIYTKNNTSNKFLIQLEKDLEVFLGANNYPKRQTLGDIFYKKNYETTDKNENALRSYIKHVSRVLKIREIKNSIIKLISVDHNKLELLRNNPNQFSKELELDVKRKIEIQDELNLGIDITILFTDLENHYKIKESTIEDLRKYILTFKETSVLEQDGKSTGISPVLKKKFLIVAICFSVIIVGLIFYSNRQKEIFDIPQEEQCEFQETSQSPRLIIFPFKESLSARNSNYAIKLYEYIKKIVDRDSLGIEVIYCDKFKNYYTRNEAFDKDKEYKKYAYEKFGRWDIKSFILYQENEFRKGVKRKKTVLTARSFKEFRERSISNGSNIYVPNMFDEDQIIMFNSYHLIVLSLANKGRKEARIKAVEYINKILLEDSITKDDVKLLETRAALKKNVDQISREEDLKLILSIDSTNTNVLYKLAQLKYMAKDSSAIDLYSRYMKKISNHCNIVTQLAKSYVIFNQDFSTAHQILNGTHPTYKTNCTKNRDFEMLRGLFYIIEGKYDNAIDILKAGYLTQVKERESFAYMLGKTYFLKKQYKKAEEILSSIENKPNTTNLKLEKCIAMNYRKMNRVDLALKYLESKNRSDFDTSFMQAHLYLENDSLDKVIKVLDKAIKYNTRDEKIKYLFNYRRIANNRINNARDAILDSLKVLDYDADFFRKKKEQGFHPSFKFYKIFGVFNTTEENVPLIRK